MFALLKVPNLGLHNLLAKSLPPKMTKNGPSIFTLLNNIAWEININMQVKTIKTCELHICRILYYKYDSYYMNKTLELFMNQQAL